MNLLSMPRIAWMVGSAKAVHVVCTTGGTVSFLVNRGFQRLNGWNHRRFVAYVEKAARSEMAKETASAQPEASAAACDHAGAEVSIDRATGEERCGDCGAGAAAAMPEPPQKHTMNPPLTSSLIVPERVS